MLIITNLILQGSVLPFLNFLVFMPNPALVSVVSLALFKGKYYGAFFGLTMGLFQDIILGDIIGVYGLIYFLIGYGIGIIQDSINNENVLVHIIFAGIGTIAYNFMYFVVMFFLSRDMTISYSLTRIFSIEILYNCILAIILYRILHKSFHMSSLKFGKR